MPGMEGARFLHRVRKLYPDTVRIVLSTRGDINSVIEAINEGAIFKFLTKPVKGELFRETLREAFIFNERAGHQLEAATKDDREALSA